jgi:hypothetical protein
VAGAPGSAGGKQAGPGATAVVRENRRALGEIAVVAKRELTDEAGTESSAGGGRGDDGHQRQAAEWEAVAQVLDETSSRKRRRMIEEEDDMPELDEDDGFGVEELDVEKLDKERRERQQEKVVKRFCDALFDDDDDDDDGGERVEGNVEKGRARAKEGRDENRDEKERRAEKVERGASLADID